MVDSNTPVLDRSQWAAALLKVPAEDVVSLAESLTKRYSAAYQTVPQAGLGLMGFRDSVMGEPFYLGEIPLSVAQVRLTDEEGQAHGGAAQVMADDAGLASAIAVCDAVLAAELPGCEQVRVLVEQGGGQNANDAKVRRAMLDRTRVSFSLMNHADDQEQAG